MSEKNTRLMKKALAEEYASRNFIIESPESIEKAVIFGFEKAIMILELDAQSYLDMIRDTKGSFTDEQKREAGKAYNLLVETAKRLHTMQVDYQGKKNARLQLV